MYKPISRRAASRLFVFDKRIFILEAWDDRPQRHAHELSLDGDVLSDIHLPDEHLSTISQKYGQWMIAYNDRTLGREWLTVFSLAGESLVSIDGLEGFPQMIPRGGTSTTCWGGTSSATIARPYSTRTWGSPRGISPSTAARAGGFTSSRRPGRPGCSPCGMRGGGGWRRSGGSTWPRATGMWGGRARCPGR